MKKAISKEKKSEQQIESFTTVLIVLMLIGIVIGWTKRGWIPNIVNLIIEAILSYPFAIGFVLFSVWFIFFSKGGSRGVSDYGDDDYDGGFGE